GDFKPATKPGLVALYAVRHPDVARVVGPVMPFSIFILNLFIACGHAEPVLVIIIGNAFDHSYSGPKRKRYEAVIDCPVANRYRRDDYDHSNYERCRVKQALAALDLDNKENGCGKKQGQQQAV